MLTLPSPLPTPARRSRGRRLRAVLTALVVLAAPLVPSVLAAAPSSALPSVATTVTGGAGYDYATDHFADPWDYSNTEDMLTDNGGPAYGLTASSWSGGTVAARFGGMGYLSPLWGGYGGSLLLGRDGARPGNQLNASFYKEVTFHLYTAAGGAGGLFWFNCPTGGVSSSCGGGTGVMLQPGWHTYVVRPGASAFGWPLAWGGQLTGLRLAFPSGADVRLDWMRVVAPGTGTTFSWSNPAGARQLAYRPAGSTGAYETMYGTSLSGTYGSWNLSELPPGSWQVGAADASGRVTTTTTVNTSSPLPRVLTPNEVGDRDYATQTKGDPWDFRDGADVAGVGNSTALSWAGGLSGTNTTNDPYVRLGLGSGGVDATTYRHLTVTSGYDGPFNLQDVAGGGTMARVQWQRADGGWGQSNDILTYSGTRTVSLDLGAGNVQEPEAPGVPFLSTSRTTLLRWDPNEDRGARRWHLNNVQLRSDFRTTGDFVVRWTDAAYAPGGTATLGASLNRTCAGARTFASVPVGPGVNSTVWSTAGWPSGAYWVCLTITRAGASTGALATGTVVVGANPPAPNQNPVVSWDVSSAYSSSAGPRYTVSGWGFDPSAPQAAMNVDLYDHRPDGSVSGVRLATGQPRVDVAAAYPGTRVGTGFSTTLAAVPGVHTYCMYGINLLGGGNVPLGCRAVRVPGPTGSLDGVTVSGSQVSVGGWAVDPSGPTQPMQVAVWVWGPSGKAATTYLRTGVARPDVKAALGWPGPSTGFHGTVATAGRGTSRVCAYAINLFEPRNNPLLGCSTTTVG